MNIDLTDKVALVTGAGSGIGRAIALSMAAAGAKVAVNDIIAARAEETAEKIRAAGGAAHVAVADVADADAVSNIVDELLSAWGRIDILCNNAGIIDGMENAADVALKTWDRLLAVNTTGPFLVTRAVLPQMIARRSGAIVNTASEAGFRGGAAGVAYTVSKHGIVGLTRAIAWAHGEQGIRCNAICPGPTMTNIAADFGPDGFNALAMERLGPVQALIPRAADPQAMANAVLFLASDQAHYINGAILPVDGGWAAG
jgi:NAD(P)-dependent dehydrogenase (short-subunit alcohol dehydrogenase family)